MGQFGDKFKQAREKRELSLDDVSNVTKIGSRMLQAIEEEHFDQLPGGVFNKGFIRAYAKHLGLNDQEAVTEYLACLRQAQIDAQASWDPQVKPAAPEKRPAAAPNPPAGKPAPKPVAANQPPPPREELPDLQLPKAEHVRPPRKNFAEKRGPDIPWRIVVVAAVVVILAIALWNRRSHAPRPETTASAASTPSKSSAPTAKTPEPAPSAHDASTSTSAHPATPGPQPAQTTQPVTQATQAATRTALPVPSNPTGPSAHAEDASPDGEAGPSSAASASVAAAKTAAPITLVIRATENSWISVTADGQPASQETLIAPAHTSVRASREIVARIGNAAGVSFLWNGKEIPAQGGESEVKTFIFDAAGMRVVAATQPAPPNR